jgi:membrane protease YdiL (CAAX protease family)
MNLRKFAPLLPYLLMSIGLLLLHNAWIALLSYHAGIVVLLSAARRWPRLQPSLHKSEVGLACGAVIFGLSGGILLYFLWPLLGIPRDLKTTLTRDGLSGSLWIWFIVYFSIVNPGLEEVYWRGYLGSAAAGLVLNDFVFSGYHLVVLGQFLKLPWLLLVFFVLGAAAWFWRQVARRSGGLLLPIISHLAADLAVILVIYHFSIHSL